MREARAMRKFAVYTSVDDFRRAGGRAGGKFTSAPAQYLRPFRFMTTHHEALDQLDQLRTEVRSLGRMLGRSIAALRGEGTLATVENLRTLAKRSRSGNAAAARELAHAVSLLTPAEALDQAMAFCCISNWSTWPRRTSASSSCASATSGTVRPVPPAAPVSRCASPSRRRSRNSRARA